jgi:hypothetical protein
MPRRSAPTRRFHRALPFLPPTSSLRRLGVALLIATAAVESGAQATATAPRTTSRAAKLTSPKDQFGWAIGDDYRLVNYTQLEAYWKKLARESDRIVKVEEIGKSAEGRTMYTLVITHPDNKPRLERYREIARRLAMAEGVGEEEARALAREGKSIVWIDGGLHATEVLGAQQLIETVWQLVSKNDPETIRFLKDDIVLATLVNPDGMELVSNWYMRNPDEKKRSTGGLPRLYQKYVGHDNNRDFYIANQPESEAINRVTYYQWFPHIVYNHHQTGPTGAIMFAPPFRDPFNYNLDPLIPLGIDQVGSTMHDRFIAEDKGGVVMRTTTSYSTWWNGGLRTMPYFHNMIGLLTETVGNPTPITIPFVPQFQLPRADVPLPITPGEWHFRQSIDYSMTANRAVLDYASRFRETLLYNTYKMARNSIERGSRDHWTISPRDIERVNAQYAAENPEAVRRAAAATGRRGGPAEPGSSPIPQKYWDVLHAPDHRDARGYIMPSNQTDFPTVTKFVNALQKGGIPVMQATRDFTVAGKSYPAGSYVVKTNIAWRPHVLDMFEPQDHPNDFRYPGGPPIPPYDNAGYTLAYQMGVQFDRILDGFDGPFEKIQGMAKPMPGTVASAQQAAGFTMSPAVNNSFIVVNRLIKSGDDVYRLPNGDFYIPVKGDTRVKLAAMARELGVSFTAHASGPSVPSIQKVRQVRVGLADRYGGNMPSGHIRWLLEQMEYPYEVVFAQQLEAGDLSSKYDVLIFPDGIIPETDRQPGQGGGGGSGFGDNAPRAEDIPAEYRSSLGSVTVARTVPAIKLFIERGGVVLTIGSSTSLGKHIGLPIADALVEKDANGAERSLPREKYYIPGSVLRVAVDNTQPIAAGVGRDNHVDVFFDNSPVFRITQEASAVPEFENRLGPVKKIAWFDSATPLRSGWAWGQKYLENNVAIASANVGKGQLFLFGPEITFRAQPHGTFKFLFNGILLGGQNGPVRTAEVR